MDGVTIVICPVIRFHTTLNIAYTDNTSMEIPSSHSLSQGMIASGMYIGIV